MKFPPLRYREKQQQWFAQRGLNWHISVLTYKDDGNFSTLTIVHVFDNASQDSATTAAVISNTLKVVKEHVPYIKFLSIRSDNAGCYHSSNMVASVKEMNHMKYGITIRSMDFSDP